MGNLAVYDFKRVVIALGGIPITDYWEGDDVIKVTRGDAAVNILIGADGGALANVSNDRSATIEIKLKPSSISNTVMEQLLRNFRQRLRANPVPFVLTDYQTAELHTSSEAIILSQPAEITYGKLATARTWQIFVGELTTGTIGQL